LTARHCCTSLLHDDPQQCIPWPKVTVDLGALGGTRTPSLLIRSKIPAVQISPELSSKPACGVAGGCLIHLHPEPFQICC